MKVLVVEDGRTTRMMLRSAVERLGHACLTAADGNEAWDLFRALEGMQAGADDYLSKTLDVDDLHLRLIAAERISELHKRLAEQDGRLRALAEVDQLTQLANRHKSTELLTRFLARAQLERMPLSLVVVDIDHFKHVNDRFGHATGDEVLKRLGATLRHSFRDEDVVARWGGEEFVIGMYAVGTSDSVTRMYRALDAVRRQVFVALDGVEFGVTFSAGVAEFPRNGLDLQTLYRSADEALYSAKDAGRARVFAAQSPALALQAAG